jgi:hypothetical protein
MEENSGNVETREAPPAIVGICAPEHFVQAWQISREWLEAALASNAQHEWTIEEVGERIMRGEWLLLLMGPSEGLPVAAAVVCRNSNPLGVPYIGIVCCGGSQMETWLVPLLDACKVLARSEGCKEVVALGRVGWVKVLAPYGIKHRASIFSVEV